jgi:hypothetical protein
MIAGVGRISWSEVVRLEGPLVMPDRLCAPKSYGEYTGVLGLVWFRAVCPLNGQARASTSTCNMQYVAFTLRGWSCGLCRYI